jgi:hypothetical protein
MSLLKMSGLAAVTAVAAMAFMGVSSAMAMKTAICTSNEAGALTCADENQFETVHAVATDMVFLSSGGNVLCSSSLLETTLLELAAPQVGHNISLTFSGCKIGLINCTVTAPTLGTISLLKTTTNLGTMQFHGMKISIQCGFGFECIYEGLPSFHLLGASSLGDSPSKGGFRGEESEMTSSADGCPPGIVLDVFWESLEPVYIKS